MIQKWSIHFQDIITAPIVKVIPILLSLEAGMYWRSNSMVVKKHTIEYVKIHLYIVVIIIILLNNEQHYEQTGDNMMNAILAYPIRICSYNIFRLGCNFKIQRENEIIARVLAENFDVVFVQEGDSYPVDGYIIIIISFLTLH